jgi:hypothetical protein
MIDQEIFRCNICGHIPAAVNSFNPSICAFCGLKVCEICYVGHRDKHLGISAEERFLKAEKEKKQAVESTMGKVDPDSEVPF